MYAVANEHSRVVHQLLSAGANINYRNRHGMTPLQVAQETENKDWLHSCPAPAKPPSNRYHGILGYPYLSKFAVTVDYGKRLLTLERGAQP